MFLLILHGMDQSDLALKLQLRGLLERLVIKSDLKKAPFANIATILFHRANRKVLTLLYPSLEIPPKEKRKSGHLFQSLPI